MIEVDLKSYSPKYADWKESDYFESDLRYCTPMTAHALEDESEQDSLLNDSQYIIEEKFDGTRGILHFLNDGCRVFSRRISKKTNWFTENTDSLPQMRDTVIPELSGTVIDGEMFIPNRPFKDVSSTLNCKWDKAIERQLELGYIVFHAFDILYYKGIRIERLSLKRRKVFLRKVIDVLESRGIKCIVEVPYFQCGLKDNNGRYIPVKRPENLPSRIKGFDKKYPTLYSDIKRSSSPLTLNLSPRGYYEFIVATGGEGVIIKDTKGRYEHKRSRGFLKIKKFYTRECILLGFTEPTKYYDGIFPDDRWDYWETPDGKKQITNLPANDLIGKGYKPLTRFYFHNWVGNMQFGVIITQEEVEKLPKNKKFELHKMNINGVEKTLLYVGECSGFDDEMRSKLSHHNYIGRVIEVKCNEIFKDTGKLRHPRFLRFRDDKDPEECTYYNHITE